MGTRNPSIRHQRRAHSLACGSPMAARVRARTCGHRTPSDGHRRGALASAARYLSEPTVISLSVSNEQTNSSNANGDSILVARPSAIRHAHPTRRLCVPGGSDQVMAPRTMVHRGGHSYARRAAPRLGRHLLVRPTQRPCRDANHACRRSRRITSAPFRAARRRDQGRIPQGPRRQSDASRRRRLGIRTAGFGG